MSPAARRLVVVSVVLAGAIGASFWLLRDSSWVALLGDVEALHRKVDDLGWAGPLALIGLMTLAIVVSPLPSAPIAMAAGAAYGQIWGTVYVVIGAELGAIIAFTAARALGGARLRQWFGESIDMGLLGSQNHLTALVLGLRLLPFVSFDIISYAAGLTPLRFWRFALATLVGVIPISFLLSHFGETIIGHELDRIGYAVLALGALTAASVYIGRRRKKKKN